MGLVFSTLVRTAIDYRFAYLIFLTHLAAMSGLVLYLDVEPYYRTGNFYLRWAGMAMLIFALGYMLWTAIRLLIERRDRPTAALARHMKEVLVRDDRYAHAIHSMTIFIAMITVFATIKSTIPSLNPFSWDQALIEADRLIFGGSDPYAVTSIVFGNVYAIITMNFFYNLWLLVVVCSMVWAAWTRDHALRLRFMFSALLGWLIAGNVLAIAFSSVGPCFVAPLLGNQTYVPLMRLLADVNAESGMVWALTAQDILWSAYTHEAGAISGISAMPSLHVVFAVIIACATWNMGHIRRWAGVAFATVIAVGSVQLGWHYAIDGIVGAALALLFWKASAYLTAWSLEKPAAAIEAV
ncbi:hypothetical protein CWR43_09215 [Rhizobium sullae]|uniref:Inositolphosphotransferase Aur1/Ipt1 domain-containing protein n=1 Tax=Rhizobium sullae TaxID=50338 RepID=A0A2N0DCG9_RHISU|nr:phosphatase PAP2 family protein [Rhizobium sullae]PKA43797.1 hypothetical protein CWR43_09215 [Rhizobium sullae]